MKKTWFYKYQIKMILALSCSIMVTVAFLNILYRYDNKYTSKAALSQDGLCLAPENGICFLADGWEFYPDKLLTPQDFINGPSAETQYKTTLGDIPISPFFMRIWSLTACPPTGCRYGAMVFTAYIYRNRSAP